MSAPLRLAMWSGPRNLSTALMYAFAARGDCAVWDEPFYACYLEATGIDHPLRAETLAAWDRDAQRVAAACARGVPGPAIHYQKHMCQHMVAGIPRGWMAQVTNVFLIRHPARVMASFAAGYGAAGLADLGFLQQRELFEAEADRLGRAPLVVDSADIRRDPAGTLGALCTALGIGFGPAMLRWEAGPRPFDGPWAPHWYGAVHRSTGFAGPEGPLPVLSGEAARIAEAARPAYEALAGYALRP